MAPLGWPRFGSFGVAANTGQIKAHTGLYEDATLTGLIIPQAELTPFHRAFTVLPWMFFGGLAALGIYVWLEIMRERSAGTAAS